MLSVRRHAAEPDGTWISYLTGTCCESICRVQSSLFVMCHLQSSLSLSRSHCCWYVDKHKHRSRKHDKLLKTAGRTETFVVVWPTIRLLILSSYIFSRQRGFAIDSSGNYLQFWERLRAWRLAFIPPHAEAAQPGSDVPAGRKCLFACDNLTEK